MGTRTGKPSGRIAGPVLAAVAAVLVLAGCGGASGAPAIDSPIATTPAAPPTTSSTTTAPSTTTTDSSTTDSSTTDSDDYDPSQDTGSILGDRTRLQVTEITDFEEIKGSGGSGADGVRGRFRQGYFVFDSDGSFRYDTRAAKNTDLFPISGYYEVNSRTLAFTGKSSSSNSNFSNVLSIAGSIERDGDGYLITLRYGASSVGAAVVNDTDYGSSFTSVYAVTMRAE